MKLERQNGAWGNKVPIYWHGMQAKLIPTSEINTGLRRHVSIVEAAKTLGVSESTIRRAVAKLGVRKIAGRTVRGGLVIEASPVDLCITYTR